MDAKIISRKEALALGLKRYFTGKLCKRGHIAERYIKSALCCGCGKIARERRSDKEKLSARRRRELAAALAGKPVPIQRAKELKLSGQRFGKWLVGTEYKTIKRARCWLCSCDCGAVRWISGTDLTKGKAKTCRKCWVKPKGLQHKALQEAQQQYVSKRACKHGHCLRWSHSSRCAICYPTHDGKKPPLLSKEEKLLKKSASGAVYSQRNKAKLKVYHSERCKLPHVREQRRAAAKRHRPKIREKYHTDIQFRLGEILRNRIRAAVRNNQKAGSAVRDLGCSIAEFKRHIERQFSGRMSWDNYGRVWVLDHRVPLAAFDLTDRTQFLQACHFTNYQPLGKKANIQKRDKKLFLV